MAGRLPDNSADPATGVRYPGNIDIPDDPIGAAATSPTSAPAKAPAARKGATKDIFTGLVEALNTYQQKLVEQKKYTVADEYEIEFQPPGMAAFLLKKPGEVDYSKTGMQDTKTAADKTLPTKNSMDTNSRSMQITAGTQIIQFIDQVMRNSTYVLDQATTQVNDATQKQEPNKTPPNNGQVAWYKISVQATQLDYDPKRHDHAYRLKYLITPYAVNTLQSNFFPNSRYRGSHKSYNYWFTGANTEILNFEQEFNNMYRLIISGIGNQIQQQSRTDFRDQARRVAMPTNENAAKGADGYTNEPGDSAASFLYSPTDLSKVKMRIVGDPAWMQQGEVAGGITGNNFSFSPFNSDGGINFDSQEVVFDISWNRPSDYDFNTGLMDINASSTKNNQPQENATYTAIKCKNFFSKGRFEQELEGRLLIEFEKVTKQASDGRPSANEGYDGDNGVVYGDGRTSSTLPPETGDWAEVDGFSTLRTDALPDEDDNQSDENNPAEPLQLSGPTSNGDLVSSFGEQNEFYTSTAPLTLPVGDGTVNTNPPQIGNREA